MQRTRIGRCLSSKKVSALRPQQLIRLRSEVAARLDSPAVPANALLFLASDEASNIQAAEIVIDGGATGAPSGAPIYRK